jgi:RimJ/RimL family protein N-acetyltransferase
LQWGGTGAGLRYPLDLMQMEQHFSSTLGETPIRRLYKAMKEDSFVGYIELNNINLEHNNAVISRVLVNKSFEGQGIGYEMVKWLTDLAFREFGFHRISLGVFDFNIRAFRCYEKVGFIKEGVLRESMKVKDSYWSSILMSILNQEWKRGFKKEQAL